MTATLQQIARLKHVLRLALVLMILAVTLAIGVHFVSTHPELWRLLEVSSTVDILGTAVTLFLVMVTNGVVLRELMAHSGLQLSVRAWLGITLVTSLLNIVSPIRGGVAVRAVYLKRVHGVPYGAFASALSATLAFNLAMSGALAAACLVALGVPGGSYGWVALGASLGLVVTLALAVWLTPPPDPEPKPELGPPDPNQPQAATSRAPAHGPHWLARALRSRHVVQLADGWRKLSQDRVLLVKLLSWNFLGALLHAAAFVFAFNMAGFVGAWLVPVTSSAFARIGSLVAITPAGLGIFEAFGAVSGQIAGAEPAQALTGVLIVRLFSVALTILGAAPFLPLVLPHVQDKP